MSRTRLCRPSLLSSKPCRDYTAAASIRDLLQRDTSLPPDITDNLERCAAALEKAAVAAGATLPTAAQLQQRSAGKQQHSKSQPALQAQQEVAAAADGLGPVKPAAMVAAAAAKPPDGSAGAAVKEAAQQGKRKKAKRRSEQPAAVTADAAPDTPAQPGTAQPAGVPATDATEPSASLSGKKNIKKRHPANGALAANTGTVERSSEAAAASKSSPGEAAAAEVQTPAPSKKKRKKEAAAANEQQNGQAAHGSSVAEVEQAINGSTGKKHKKRKQQEPRTDS